MIKVSTKAEILLNADLKGLIRERDEYFQAKNTMHNKSLRERRSKNESDKLIYWDYANNVFEESDGDGNPQQQQ